MWNKNLGLCFLLLLQFNGFSAPLLKDTRVVAGSVFIEPTSLMDIYNGSCLKIGTQYYLGKRWAAYGVGGIYQHGTYGKAGIKLFLNHPREDYISCSFYLKHLTRTITDNRRQFDTGRGYVEGNEYAYSILKRGWGVNIEMGEQASGRYFTFEYFGGIGLRSRTVTSSIGDSVYATLYHYHESIIENLTNGPSYREILPTLSCGIRLGIVYHRKKRIGNSRMERMHSN